MVACEVGEAQVLKDWGVQIHLRGNWACLCSTMVCPHQRGPGELTLDILHPSIFSVLWWEVLAGFLSQVAFRRCESNPS